MNKLGRPTVITPLIVLKLEQAFRDGFSVSKACELSGISRSTYYEHYGIDSDFQDKMQLAQGWVTEKARKVVVNAIDCGDLQSAKWWLERKAKSEFGIRATEQPKFEDTSVQTGHKYLREIAEALLEANKDLQPNDPFTKSDMYSGYPALD